MKRKLRFCMLATFYPPFGFGGDAIQVERLSLALAERGHDVTVVTSQAGADPRDERREGVRVVRFPGPALLLRRLVPVT